jgi:chemotaxis protein MotD
MPSHPAAGSRWHASPEAGDGAFASLLDEMAATPDRREPHASTAKSTPETSGPQSSQSEDSGSDRAAAADETGSDQATGQTEDDPVTPAAETEQSATLDGNKDKVVATAVGDLVGAASEDKAPTDCGDEAAVDPAAINELAAADQTLTVIEQQPPAVPVQTPTPPVSAPPLPDGDEMAVLDLSQERPLGARTGDASTASADDATAAASAQTPGPEGAVAAASAPAGARKQPTQARAGQAERPVAEAASPSVNDEHVPEETVGANEMNATAKPSSTQTTDETLKNAAKDKPTGPTPEPAAHQYPPEPASAAATANAGGNAQVAHANAPGIAVADAHKASSDQPAIPIAGLALEIAARAQSGNTRFEIRLDPPELGRVDVRLDVDRHGQVTSRLVVEKAETLDLLRREAPELERALQQAGLKTGDSGLQFTLRDQSFAGGDRDTGGRAARLLVTDPELAAVDAATTSYGRNLRLGSGVDIRI